jgi:hypothetical protein
MGTITISQWIGPIGDGLAVFERGMLRLRRRGETDDPLAAIDW